MAYGVSMERYDPGEQENLVFKYITGTATTGCTRGCHLVYNIIPLCQSVTGMFLRKL